MRTQNERLNLSAIARDPVVAEFFVRGERDGGAAFAVPSTPTPVITGGAARLLESA